MSTYTPISSATLTSDSPSVTFSNIPQTYTDLIICAVNRNTSASNADVIFRFNNDSGSNYSFVRIFGAWGASASGTSDRSINSTYISGCWTPGTNSNSSIFGTSFMNINNYSNDTNYKTLITTMDTYTNANQVVGKTVGMWRNSNPINSITISSSSGNLLSGSTFNVYGISSLPSVQAKATGGDTVVSDGTYWYHTFRSSGTFTPTQSLNADVLMVAGGGSGGSRAGGGGGAGGVVYSTSQSLSASNYTVTVGAGGAAVVSVPSNRGNNGSNTTFTGLTNAIGGGGGGVYPGTAGLTATTGGSGGGGGSILGSTSGAGAAGTSGQGNAGGNGASNAYHGGGGGGAGGAGSNGNISQGGNGGIGTSSYSSLALATYTGQNVGGTRYFAGGGGGCVSGAGGSGGGGNGSDGSSGNASAGVSNTGGGGGGARNAPDTSNVYSGAGGSGIVIVRYPV